MLFNKLKDLIATLVQLQFFYSWSQQDNENHTHYKTKQNELDFKVRCHTAFMVPTCLKKYWATDFAFKYCWYPNIDTQDNNSLKVTPDPRGYPPVSSGEKFLCAPF